ncbi:hypothetical protein [Saccharolobus caldissimus]|uniref:Uncharacterized protein n=1 Tax=Saccharolobus caldissimus TaxID=1702097 RepID=A0AAQ4CSC9_9CREN|nr:hypothetical protein [Saccharolobus caldissimus]BDB98710.1 hypothetical protein SACC_17270 [Saccharolobus caldissimus]
MNYKTPLILAIVIAIAIIVGILVFANSHTANITNNNDSLNYTTIGIIYTYNISPLVNFVHYYYNNSNISLIPQIVGNGTIRIIVFNETKAIISYFKASSPLSSLAFYAINETLVKHGFKFSQYNTLLYDYKNTTAFGFDGYYFYLVSDNGTLNTTIMLLKYLYTSQKIFTSQQSENIIAYGNINNNSFTLFSESSQIILKSNSTLAFNNITQMLKYFNITLGNFTAAGKVIFKNSSIIIYSINSTYKGKNLYIIVGIKNNGNNQTYEVLILSHNEISINEVFKELS